MPGCEQFSYRSCNIESAACQLELYELMACLRGEAVDAGPPPVSVMTEAAVESMLLSEADPSEEPEDPEQFPAIVRGLELLGLLEPGLIGSESDVVDATLPSTLAFYRPETRDVVIIDRGEPHDDLDSDATLAHEFVHALQDRRHDLGSFGADAELDSDASLALSAVVEGEARLYEVLMVLAYSGVRLRDANYAGVFQFMIEEGEKQSLIMGSPMLTGSVIFPYTYGARYMGQHWLQGKGAALDQIFEQPPESTLEVMWQGSAERLPELEPFSVQPAPLPGYRFIADDVVGSWMLMTHLLEATGRGSAELEPLSQRWKGDRLWIYQSEDEPRAGAVVWWIDWVDAASASRFVDLWGVGISAPVSIEVVGTRTRVVIAERMADLGAWVERAAEALPN